MTAPMRPGEVIALTPLVRRVLAPNPSVMTGPGTNTYLVGTDEVAVIDPGPDDHEEHLDRVAEAGAGRIRWILVTHTHSDHSPGAAGLKERTGAQVLGFDERDGFVPDATIGDGSVVEGTGFRLRALHTPGHASNHLCYHLEGERLLFSGDHIMSGSTVVIAPPDGDMAAYLQALRRLKEYDLAGVAPGHGDWIAEPAAKVDEYLTHRAAREGAILDALRHKRTAHIEELVEAVYTDVPPMLHPIARWSVWAHLRKLRTEDQAATSDPDDIGAEWQALP
ncbi:MAG TPA: MBL fold metallo-hydrolase [Acidimicrobiales bacterium]|nr:MBL fold metallo-hydrolase [Acidimicrobiales bacterium]